MFDCLYLHSQAKGRDSVGSTVFVHSPSTLLDREPPARPALCDWTVRVDHDVMWLAVGFEKHCTGALVFQLAIHGNVCLGSLTAESCSRVWTQLDVFPSPALAWAVQDFTHAGSIVLLDPSMTCLLPVYTPFLLWQHRGLFLGIFCIALRYASTCSTSCLVSMDGRSSR